MCFGPKLGLLKLELVYVWVIVKDLFQLLLGYCLLRRVSVSMSCLRVCGGIKGAFSFVLCLANTSVPCACGKTAHSCLMEVY